MTSILKADTIQDAAGNNIINENANTITIGASGDTITIPSGATLSNLGTASGFGITEADQWRLTADFASDAIITANLERTDTYGFGLLGTGMSESSGVFTFPSTGFWLITYQGRILSNNYGNASLTIMVTTDNASYNNAGQVTQGNDGTGDDGTATGIYIVDVTSTTNVKVKFRTNAFGSGTTLRGNTNRSDTCFTFIKLGAT